MKVSRVFVSISIIVLLVSGFSTQAHADLELLGQGTSAYGTYNLIYDTDLDITWYDYTSETTNWQNQMDWADGLSVNFNGNIFNDWRLPTTTQPDSSCDLQQNVGGGFPLQGYSTNCTGSEMGDLYYTELENVSGFEEGCLFGYDCGLMNTGDFQNLQISDSYWSGTELVSDTPYAWIFDIRNGRQGILEKDIGIRYAMAVHPGRTVVPEPISSTLFIVGGATLGFRRFRKKFRK